MKTQVIGKKLLLPLIVIEIAATVVGLNSPAQSTFLIGFQGKVNNANSEAMLIARHRCRPKPDCNPGYMRIGNEPSSSLELSRDEIEENIRSQPYRQQHQPSPDAEPLPKVELPPTVVPSPKVEPLPTAEPAPQN